MPENTTIADMHFCDGGPLTAQYLLVVDCLNFCFWPDDEVRGACIVCGHRVSDVLAMDLPESSIQESPCHHYCVHHCAHQDLCAHPLLDPPHLMPAIVTSVMGDNSNTLWLGGHLIYEQNHTEWNHTNETNV